ncbi:AraC family transcriptional regulator [Chitinophaga sancti]|uniref:AraC family transcriptional regulator n=1 Tax=Chitinophaga sancti TaxID=1004 RepID=A0ABZ0XKH4_9BACT|nr:AraC family transcriptional regulator [Chitinophaga sancti]WQD63245.1 AraC family transcriptional regulator [Chitinophaga sancti]WQG91129.1 AraC family transcriptional regulator [Chitinophaga sancti]
MNIFESYEQAQHVPLTFHDLVITSMVRGHKVMHLMDRPSFDYLPGETVIVPPNETMIIDFPEASLENPTQCIALAVDDAYLKDTIEYLHAYYNIGEDRTNWQLTFNKYHFENDDDITALINKLINVCSSGDKAKNIYADLHLKELLIRLIQSQHLEQAHASLHSANNQSRMQYVLHYIQEHLTEKIAVDALSRKAYLSRNLFFKWFREQFGITPLEYINKERVKLAKQLLSQPLQNVNTVSKQCGFSDVNYFVRVFKQVEGITPKAYQSCII